jgi:enoyl-CoA hydratase
MKVLSARDEGAVRVLTLTNPPGNTLTLATLREFKAAVDAAGGEPRVRALLLESGVPGYFSSGMELGAVLALPESDRTEPFAALFAAYRALLTSPKPCVAALSGSAILGGWILAMGCDWRVLAEGGKIALSEVRAGLSPTPALIGRLAQLSSSRLAVKEMVLRGRSLGSAEALAAELVDEVVPEDQVKAAALALAKRLAKSPPRAFASIKQALNESAADEGLWRRSLAEFTGLFANPEAVEGLAALRDKKRPRWEAA